MPANDKLILALSNGRILKEVMPLLYAAGIRPEPEFDNPDTRLLRFQTNDPHLDIVRARAFDVATLVAFGAAHLGVAGNDVIVEFDYSEIYAPLDLGIGKCRLSVAEPADLAGPTIRANGAMCASPRNIRTSRANISRVAACRPNASR